MLSAQDRRHKEVARYEHAYRHPDYRLGDRRARHIHTHLARIPKGSLLDVSTGRGEVLFMAKDMGFAPVMGTEAVSALCDGVKVVQALAHELPFPDSAFDTVTMFDVMEHLLPEDTAPVCRELMRVARQRVLLTIHNGSHRYRGEELHINRRPSYDVWFDELRAAFAPHQVVCHGAGLSISVMYEVILT